MVQSDLLFAKLSWLLSGVLHLGCLTLALVWILKTHVILSVAPDRDIVVSFCFHIYVVNSF